MGYHGMDERDLQRARREERRGNRLYQHERDAMWQLQQIERQWTQNMGVYWRERLQKLRVYDTGALYNSIVGMIHQGPNTTIEHQFLLYGKYIDDGVGREFGTNWYSRGGEGTWNAGQLPFLLPGGEEYRERHGLNKPKKVGPAWGGRVAGGHPRQKKPWFFKKYYASRMWLNEVEAAAYGQAYQGVIASAFDQLTGQIRLL